jgi:hypothetical protein
LLVSQSNLDNTQPDQLPGRVGLLVGKLEQCFTGYVEDVDRTAARHCVTSEIFGVESSKLLTEAQTRAWLSEYIAASMPGRMMLAGYALNEMRLVYEYAIARQAVQEVSEPDSGPETE